MRNVDVSRVAYVSPHEGAPLLILPGISELSSTAIKRRQMSVKMILLKAKTELNPSIVLVLMQPLITAAYVIYSFFP